MAARGGLSKKEARKLQPNVIISTTFQAAWEKLFKYNDVDPIFIAPRVGCFCPDPEDIRAAIDENTAGVVAVLGDHYAGHYHDVAGICKVVREVNAAKGYQVAVHVDAASGGFVAPFQDEVPAWDFRLPEVVSISASGHKFGESCVGTGFVVWRQRENLSDHVAISVSYLGGKGESFTLNFSRPASGPMVQLYKFLRLGTEGYRTKVRAQMETAKFLRDGLKAMTHKGLPRWIMIDGGDSGCLPVVSAYLNPALKLAYDDIDFQHIVAEHHWYVSAYAMSFHHPVEETTLPLFSDAPATGTMMRIVVKSNLTMVLARNLLSSMTEAIEFLDGASEGYLDLHGTRRGKGTQHHTGHVC